MNAQDIDTYLADLGHELGHARLSPHALRILMIGGAYMLTQVGNRPATKDIDILFTDLPDPTASPFYRPFRTAVHTVARRHGLPASWINEVIGDALRNYGPTPQGTLWRSYCWRIGFPDEQGRRLDRCRDGPCVCHVDWSPARWWESRSGLMEWDRIPLMA